MHIGIKFAGSAVSGLNLVNDDKKVVLFGNISYRFDKFICQHIDSAFTLYGFKHNCTAFVVFSGLLKRLNIVCFGKHEALGKGRKFLVKNVLSRCCKRCKGAPVKAVFKGDYVVILPAFFFAVSSCKLNGTLVCFRTGIAEENLFHVCSFAKHFCKLGARLGIVKIGRMLKQRKLTDDRVCPFTVCCAESVDSDSASEIKILFSVRIGHNGSFSADDFNGKTGISMRNIFRIKLLGIHFDFHLTF